MEKVALMDLSYEELCAFVVEELGESKFRADQIGQWLYRGAEILILDDATSSLDLRTEEAFYKALESDYAGITRIVIAHRIASIRHADRIAVMENGTVSACGTHEELLETSALYREICASQMAEQSTGLEGREILG